ncbi:hypothetical protein DXG03_004615 [Asterophora parasitica]|uniref:Uncharacterized protein n=1 Tax=Asterophora parasitica TaxID=117018 RepID=A0A9P7G9K2_9AGAR|nr:hypothetical protein DXG03_004615 [Asterophora parasitica]
MAPHDDLLRNLCGSDETFNEAQSVLRLAKQKTGPGSGHDLGPHKTGLPAICAYIASTRLNSSDVTRKNAQVASCLKASDFDRILFLVKTAIAGGRRSSVKKDIYDSLINTYAPTLHRQQLVDWMMAANRALIQSDNTFTSGDTTGGQELKHAIFFWTFNAVHGKNVMTQVDFTTEHHINAKIFTKLLNKLNGCCTSVKARIQNDIQVKRSPAKPVATTPRRSPKKLRVLPSRDSPTKRKVVEQPVEPVEPTSDDEVLQALLPETPSKKRKADLSTRPAPTLIHPRQVPFPPLASSSRVTLDSPLDDSTVPVSPQRGRTESHSHSPLAENAMDVDDDGTQQLPSLPEESDDDSLPIRRRFRPVYLDHKQWYGIDKRLKRLWKQAERHKQNSNEHPFRTQTL